MRLAKRFLSFWYHFIVGDDWRIALGIIIGLFITYELTHHFKINSWWLLPLLILLLLSISLRSDLKKPIK